MGSSSSPDVGAGSAGRVPPTHPWDGFLTGPENALAQRQRAGPGAGRGGGGLAAGRARAGGGGEVAAAGGPGRRAALAAARARRWRTWRPRRSRRPAPRRPDAPGGWAELRGRFRALDLFVLEDLHALERAPLALAELTAHARRPGRRRARAWRSRRGSGRGSGGAGRRGWSTGWSAAWPSGSTRPAWPRAAATCSTAPGRAASRSRPRPSTCWPRPPTATGPSTAGSPASP